MFGKYLSIFGKCCCVIRLTDASQMFEPITICYKHFINVCQISYLFQAYAKYLLSFYSLCQTFVEYFDGILDKCLCSVWNLNVCQALAKCLA